MPIDYKVRWEPCNVDISLVLNPFIENNANVESIVYRHEVMYGNGPYIDSCPFNLTSISAPNLVDVVPSEHPEGAEWRYFGTVEIGSCNWVESISFPKLTRCGYLWIVDCNSLTSLDLSKLEKVQRDGPPNNFYTELQIYGTWLTSLSLPEFVEIAAAFGEVIVIYNSSLATVSMPKFLPRNGHEVDFRFNALNQASVDHILARCVANPAYVSGTVKLQGGTNAAPSVAGLADKATLIGRGVTVVTN